MEKILDRVRKLFALAGNNANENEALAALEKAHAILAEHNLTVEQVGVAEEKVSADDVRDGLETETTMPERHFRWIWMGVAKANSCHMFYNRPNPKKYKTIYTLVGRKVNILVATHMALYLCQTAKRLCAENCKAAGRTDHAYKNAYLVGMASRLHARLLELNVEHGKRTGTGNALVLWSEREEKENKAHIAEKMGIKLCSTKVAKVKYDTAAYNRGAADANAVNLSPQVAAKPKAAMLA